MSKFVLVTGASGGIGKGIAKVLGSRGYKVALVSRTEKELKLVQSSIEEAGGKACVHVADTTDYESVQRMVDNIVTEHGLPDVLVNNAGVGHQSMFVRSNPKHWKEMIDCNIIGYLNTMRIMLPEMVARKKGHVINIGSMSSIAGNPGMSVYGGTKSFWNSTIDALRKEHRINT